MRDMDHSHVRHGKLNERHEWFICESGTRHGASRTWCGYLCFYCGLCVCVCVSVCAWLMLARRIYEWVISRIRMSHSTHLHESEHIREWWSHTHESHVMHGNEWDARHSGKKEIKVTSTRKRLHGDRYNCHKEQKFIPFRYAKNIGTTCCTLKLYFLCRLIPLLWAVLCETLYFSGHKLQTCVHYSCYQHAPLILLLLTSA